jgi:2-oxoglutarate/2-oxoacid ferredoxin oxidoreductase subunit beta
MTIIAERPASLTDDKFHYCPGCTHGIIHRLVAEAIDTLEIRERTVGVASVGCSVLAYNYFDMDMVQAAHGRAPAVATGLKRVFPDNIVFTYQGDGDLAAIGLSEILHSALRGENITVVFVNNAIYGMTGGQMAPTTLLGQKTTTSPLGRKPLIYGNPIKMCELLATQQGPAYISRVSVHDPRHVRRAQKSITKAFQVQKENLGFSLVEILSTCPTNWGLSPQDSLKWLEKEMIPMYPLGEFRTVKELV